MRTRLLLSVALSLASASSAHARFEDWLGHGFTSATHEYRSTFSSNGLTYANHLLFYPTVEWWDQHTVYDPDAVTVTVISNYGSLVSYHFPFNDGTTASGEWYQIDLPDGVSIQYTVVVRITGTTHALFTDGISYGMGWGFPIGTSYTSPTTYIDSDSPTVVNAKNAALGLAGDYLPDGWGRFERFSRYVREHVVWQTDMPGMTTASAVLSGGAGDCKRMAVAVAAMARADGIPVALVSGVAYGGSAQPYGFGVNGGHMWLRVWTGHTWVDCDPWTSTVYVSSVRGNWASSDEYLSIVPGVDTWTPVTYLGYSVSVSDRSDSAVFSRQGTRNPGMAGTLYTMNQVPGGWSGAPQMSAPRDSLGSSGLTDVAAVVAPPVSPRLSVSPNPSAGAFRFSLPSGWRHPIDIYDARGRCVARLERDMTDWRPSSVPSGVYFARTGEGTSTATVKLQLLR